MPTRRVRLWVAGLLAVVLLAPLALSAQRGFFGGGRYRGYILPNVPYDGQFTFARIRYLGRDSWDADYPQMERNLTTILDSLTSIRAADDEPRRAPLAGAHGATSTPAPHRIAPVM